MTNACRIHSERQTRFPFDCPLSHVLRVARLFKHGGLQLRHSGSGELLRSEVRERSFLENPRTPDAIKRSVLQVAPLPGYVRPANVTLLQLQAEASAPTDVPADDDVSGASGSARGKGGSVKRVHIPWPLNDAELAAVLEPYGGDNAASPRVLHLLEPDKLFVGFSAPGMQKAYAAYIQSLTSRWCCRASALVKAKGVTKHVEFSSVPEKWRGLLPPKDDAYTLT